MYHLTKEFSIESKTREDIFYNMVISNYSYASLLKYKMLYEADVLEKTKNKYSHADVGYNIRHMLAAIALKGNIFGLKIISHVDGKGKYCFCSDWLEFVYSDILAECANIADKNKVYNFVKIKDNRLYIDINYSGSKLPKLYSGFSGVLRSRNAKIHYFADLLPSKAGVRKSVKDYLYDRLSPVSLAFL